MIEKFISIKNVGRFRDCSPRGDVAFRKLTLLFAENGRGKTTLCAILRSLQTGQHEFISERKTLGSTGLTSVQMRIGANNVSFGNNAWSATHPDIAIFDSAFIHDNVYAGDYVDLDQKRNLYRVIVGAQGVQLAKQIEDLDGKIREANNEIRLKKDAVSTSLPNGVTLDIYLSWRPVEDIENKIHQKNLEIANRQHTLEKATEIQAKGLLAKLIFPVLPSDCLTVLSKQISDVVEDAEARVRAQILAHNMGSQGEEWLSEGLGFVVGGTCPFCGQGITANELIAAYRSHFNAAYKSLKQEVAHLRDSITDSIGDAALLSTQQVLSGNLALVEFWKQFAQIDLPAFAFDDIRAKYAKLCGLAYALAQRKQQTPTEAISPDDDFNAALAAVTAMQESLESYNAAVGACNALINAQKKAVQQGADINVMKRELAVLAAKRKRCEPTVVQACKEYQDAQKAKTTLDQQKAAAKQRLDQYCERILQTYEQAINTYLDQFNAGFKITNSRHLYPGGTPSSQYQIQINNHAIDLGDSRTQPGTPCFKTALSSGDRSALALAFFLAAMNRDVEIGNKIVVLDDPFTSQDRFRRTCTKQLIQRLAGVAKQIIVLSHDPHFLKLLWDGHPPHDIKVLQMCLVGGGTVISEWDIEAETQSTYLKNYSTLLDYYREQKGTPLDVARAIRPFVEGLLRAHFPGRFPANEWLGNFLEKIRQAGKTDGLEHAHADLSEIEAINDYSCKYHHDQNPNADSEPISADELHGYVKRTLRLVGGC